MVRDRVRVTQIIIVGVDIVVYGCTEAVRFDEWRAARPVGRLLARVLAGRQ